MISREMDQLVLVSSSSNDEWSGGPLSYTYSLRHFDSGMEKRRPEEIWGHATAFGDLQVGIGTCRYGIVPDAVSRRYT